MSNTPDRDVYVRIGIALAKRKGADVATIPFAEILLEFERQKKLRAAYDEKQADLLRKVVHRLTVPSAPADLGESITALEGELEKLRAILIDL